MASGGSLGSLGIILHAHVRAMGPAGKSTARTHGACVNCSTTCNRLHNFQAHPTAGDFALLEVLLPGTNQVTTKTTNVALSARRWQILQVRCNARQQMVAAVNAVNAVNAKYTYTHGQAQHLAPGSSKRCTQHEHARRRHDCNSYNPYTHGAQLSTEQQRHLPPCIVICASSCAVSSHWVKLKQCREPQYTTRT